jgi:mRNA-degrading endonuclease toxin of MazEF toxin-antitoxin module
MKPGDLVLIRFPQTDLQQGKLRPALVVAIAPGRHADVLLALVTSRSYQAIPNFDEVIQPSDPDFSVSRLKTRSVIRLARLATVEPSVIEAKLGSISPDRLTRIRTRMADWLKPGR